ncbi:MAG TPA: hypothetical protein VEG39_01755 [Clostridia bacterium]|nr:hypothetical protein [Clostridia bacterium]
MFEVKVPKLRFSKDKVLVSGDLVDIKDKALAARLLKKGYVKIAVDSSKKIVSIGETGSDAAKGKAAANTETLTLGDKNAKEAIAFVESLNSIEELEKLFKEESEGKNRSTVISAIRERAAQLYDEDNPEDPENAEASLNLQLNPDDTIVS